jgi:3-oxoacyl-[acyl-carrier protein] reductase
MASRFAGKTALVTGSSRGIGLATAMQLGREGARVMINARKQDELAATREQLEAAGIEVGSVLCNVAEDGGPESAVEACVERFGGLDLLVNTVGASACYGPLLEADRESFERTMIANTWPLLALARLGIEHGLEGGGAIVSISTIGSRQVQPLVGVYGAAKAALESLVRVLARELGPRGVRVNAVAPGLVRTKMSTILWEGEREQAEARLLPLQRLGEPPDIAAAVVFLLSEEAAWITGATLDVDGGRLIVGDEPYDLIGQHGRS